MWTITSVLLCTCLVASEAPRAERRRLATYNYLEVAKLTAADAAASDLFGLPVAVDGDTVVVGALGDDDRSGSAYVFHTSDGGASYGQVAKLTASDAADNEFGWSVAIDGDTVVVGTYAGGWGSVYVFRTTDGGATYGQVAKLTASDAASGDIFGLPVAISGDVVVVGAYGKGAVYIFRTTDGGATYTQVTQLTGSAYDDFGISVAIDGATVVVGSPYDDDGGRNSGSAYVFRTSDGGATYVEVAKLTAADAASNDEFGISVAIDGATVVVGARYDDKEDHYTGSNWGSAYVFHTSDGGATYDQNEQRRAHQRRDALLLLLLLRRARLRSARRLRVVVLVATRLSAPPPQRLLGHPLQRARRVLARLLPTDDGLHARRALHARRRRERRRRVARDGRRDLWLQRHRLGHAPRLGLGQAPPQRGQFFAQGVGLAHG